MLIRFFALAISFLVSASALAQTPGFDDSPQKLGFDESPQQLGRVRAQKVDEAIRLLPKGIKLTTQGAFTVGITLGRLQLANYASDSKTPIGAEPDIAQLIADSLSLKLIIIPIAWEDWPLGVSSGRFDAAISNVTVTEQRKAKFDFSTYRQDLLGIYVTPRSPVQIIKQPSDVAGLLIIVGAATNQEQILLRWNEQNIAKGLKPVEIQYQADEAVLRLALLAGRADAYFGPNSISVAEARSGVLRLAGLFSGGWPQTAEIAVATRKGSGLADAITAAINAQIANGNYAKLLARWELTAEAIEQSRTNPPGLPEK